MSCSTLYAIFNTTVSCVEEFPNGHGTAPPVWGYLGMNYLGHTSPHQSILVNGRVLWDLARDARVPEPIRIIHAFCFDYAICPREELKTLESAARQVDTILRSWEPWRDCVNHWGAIADALRDLKLGRRAKGVGLGCTSVCDPWEDRPKDWHEKVFDCIAYAKVVRRAEVSHA